MSLISTNITIKTRNERKSEEIPVDRLPRLVSEDTEESEDSEEESLSLSEVAVEMEDSDAADMTLWSCT